MLLLKKIDYLSSLMITNKVILNIDVFGLTMKLWVMNKSNVVLIVIKMLHGTKLLKSNPSLNTMPKQFHM
jgi:hypothetical protein